MFDRRVEILRPQQFQRQSIRRAGNPDASTGFKVTKPGAVIEDSIYLMRLLARRVEVAQRPEIGVLFNGDGPFGIEIVSHSGCRGKIETLKTARKGIVENGIHDDVDRMQVPTDDRSNFRSVAPLIPMLGIVTELEVCGVKELAIIRMR